MTRKGCEARREEARVGVILCDCGSEMPRLLDLKKLARGIRADRRVGLLVGGPRPCTEGLIDSLGTALARRKLDRVVVAGCSERLFGRFFRERLGRFGIDPSLIDFADIKNLSALVHGGARAAATAKALALVRSALARLAAAAKAETVEADIKPVCAVFGGGVAGVTAAMALATRGVKVVLVERREAVGGLVGELNVVYPSYLTSAEYLEGKRGELAASDVEVITGAAPVAVKGHVGSFEIALSNGRSVEAGAIIVATGASLLVPEGLFGYGANPRVITQMDLEGILKRGEDPGRSIVMIQCAGSRNEARPYCSRVCCTASIVNTIIIKQRYPDAKITLLSRGFAEYAGDLDRARQMGVEILRYSPDRPPVVKDQVVDVYDEISEMEARLPFDLVVLAVPMVPSESTRDLARMLKMPTDSFGFIVEPHLKIRPEDAVPRGIFVAGCAHWPSTMTESIVQAYGAASRAYDLLHTGKLARTAIPAAIDREHCRGCGLCAEACQHGAIDLTIAEDGLKRAEVVRVACTGCGVCVSVCPSGAATLASAASALTDRITEAITEA